MTEKEFQQIRVGDKLRCANVYVVEFVSEDGALGVRAEEFGSPLEAAVAPRHWEMWQAV